jgi:hypothetical protein
MINKDVIIQLETVINGIVVSVTSRQLQYSYTSTSVTISDGYWYSPSNTILKTEKYAFSSIEAAMEFIKSCLGTDE